MKRKLIFCILLVSVIALVLACIKVRNPQETKGPATLSEITTAAAVDDNGQAMGVAREDFSADTPTIYLSARVNTAPENTQITARWIYFRDADNREVNRTLYDDSVTVKGTRYFSFGRRAPAGAWEAGQYLIQIKVDGREYADARFQVKAVQQAKAQAPTITFFKAEPEAISTGQPVVLSWSTTEALNVEISAVGKVPSTGNRIVTPVTGMEYVLTATNSAGATSARAQVQVTSLSSNKPELVITDFWIEGDRAQYKIRNIAEVQAKPSTTYLYIDGNYRDSSRVEVLAPGQERAQLFPNYNWTYGAARSYRLPVRVCADARNEVGEYDENNNCLVVEW